MQKLIIILSTLALLTLATTPPSPFDCTTAGFDAYIQTYSKNYTTSQYNSHLIIYQANCTNINNHNADPQSTYYMKITAITDLNQSDANGKIGVTSIHIEDIEHTIVRSNLMEDTKVGAVPTTLNYVSQGKVTSVKDQGTCGSCWSFASAAMYESVLLIRGHSYGLSEQAILQCASYYAPNQRQSDCSGGYFKDSLTFLAAVGDVLRSQYPYLAYNYGSGPGYPISSGACSDANRIMIGDGTATVYAPLTDIQLKQLLVDQGPVMIGMYANTGFMSYSSGVYSGCPLNSVSFINHAITLVGYSDASSYWLAKNQWGTSWGESGYVKISYTNDCGLKSLVGNIVYSSYNTDPQVTVSSSLLYGDSGAHEPYLIAAFLALLGVLALVV